jgi:hypothetical protein
MDKQKKKDNNLLFDLSSRTDCVSVDLDSSLRIDDFDFSLNFVINGNRIMRNKEITLMMITIDNKKKLIETLQYTVSTGD